GPRLGVGSVTVEVEPPEEGGGIDDLVDGRRRAVRAGAKLFLEELKGALEVTGAELEQCVVPGEMLEERGTPVVGRVPVVEEVTAGLRVAEFEADMGDGVGAVAVTRVELHGALRHGPGLHRLEELVVGEAKRGEEPPVVAVVIRDAL